MNIHFHPHQPRPTGNSSAGCQPAVSRTASPHDRTKSTNVRPNLTLGISLLLPVLAASALATPSQTSLNDSDLTRISFEQKLGAHISPGLQFVDENAKTVRLGKYFGRKPIVLLLGYYRCPMLCTLVQNGLIECLGDIRWSIGKEYEVINVSIDPAEAPALASGKKRSALKRYGRDEAAAGWHFLTGGDPAIKELAQEIGFHYAYDPVAKEYAHPSGFVVLTPEGKISHYFFGVTFPPKDVLASLQTASKRSIGARAQDLVLLCFHYRPITGRYGKAIIYSTRALGVATVIGLAVLITSGVRRRNPSAPLPAAEAASSSDSSSDHLSTYSSSVASAKEDQLINLATPRPPDLSTYKPINLSTSLKPPEAQA